MFTLNEQGSKEVEAYEEQLKEVSKIIHSSAADENNKMTSEDLSQGLLALNEMLRNCRVQR